jgi:hypothetical protein
MTIVSDIISGLAKPVTDLISEFITDKDKAAELGYKVATMAAEHAHAETLAQLAVNQAEASSGSLWNGGWRPFVGWTCGFALANNFILVPLLGPVLAAYTEIRLVPFDLTVMLPILLGMLGLGYLRTDEKKAGVATK